MTETTVDAISLLDRLEADLDALPGETGFQRALDANRHARAHLEWRIATIQGAAQTLADVVRRIAVETKRLDELITWRKQLCDELLSSPSHPRTDIERGRIQNLTFSIQVLDRGLGAIGDSGWSLNTLRLGQLFRDTGYVEAPRIENQVCGALPWFGSMPDVERRLMQLHGQRDAAERQLQSAVLEAPQTVHQ